MATQTEKPRNPKKAGTNLNRKKLEKLTFFLVVKIVNLSLQKNKLFKI